MSRHRLSRPVHNDPKARLTLELNVRLFGLRMDVVIGTSDVRWLAGESFPLNTFAVTPNMVTEAPSIRYLASRECHGLRQKCRCQNDGQLPLLAMCTAV